MNGALDISLWRLSLAYLLFLVIFIITWRKNLRLEKDMAVSVVRMTVQLAILGYILTFLFKINLWYVITGIYLLMIFFASQTVIKRSGLHFKGMYKILFPAILLGCGTVLVFFILFIVHNQPWYDPRYFIPLSGMMLGNSMNGSVLALERFYNEINQNRLQIETWIAFGATAKEASRDAFRKAYRASLMPMLTSMTGMGLVFLPGMMTGQILGGSPPITAIKYQIAIMSGILTSIALTAYIILTLEYVHFFDHFHLPKENIFGLAKQK